MAHKNDMRSASGPRSPVGEACPVPQHELSREEVETGFGLFRREALTCGPTRSLRSLFADLRSIHRGQIFGQDPQRDTQGTRVMADGTLGHGFWEFYRLGRDLYIVTGDSVYDAAPRMEILPGEGLLEFHLRLAGALVLSVPAAREPVTVTGPCMLMLYQPPGIDVPERILADNRDTGVSLYCRPEYLAELAERNGIARWDGLDQIASLCGGGIWNRQVALNPTLLHSANSLLRNPYQGGVRLLYAESIALALLCEILTSSAPERRQESFAQFGDGGATTRLRSPTSRVPVEHIATNAGHCTRGRYE